MTLYATYFDSNFLIRGLACLQSIAGHSRTKPRFLVLALDDRCADSLSMLQREIGEIAELKILTLNQLEQTYPELRRVKADRTNAEYYFTLTPFLAAEALRAVTAQEYAVYIDADLFFFCDSELALDAAENAPVAIVEHRFRPSLEHLATMYGRFNVGWNAFRPSLEAAACLNRWQQQCLEWCSGTPDQSRFADQMYLDDWPETVGSLKIVEHPGVNLAPWNTARHKLSRAPSGELVVDGLPLIFFHFHRLKRLSSSVYETDFNIFGRIGSVLADSVYRPYLEALDRIEAGARKVMNWAPTVPVTPIASRADWTVKSFASAVLRVGRLLTRRRVIFRKGIVVSPWTLNRHV